LWIAISPIPLVILSQIQVQLSSAYLNLLQ
jgi:hypothetical protein